MYGGDLGSTRYSPLDQIDASNVGELEIAWQWSARNFGPVPENNYRTTPIMVGGVLYATAGSRRAIVESRPRRERRYGFIGQTRVNGERSRLGSTPDAASHIGMAVTGTKREFITSLPAIA